MSCCSTCASAVVIRAAQLNDEMRRLAITDPLTGLNNRRLFVDKLEEYVKRARRYGEQLTLLLLDCDAVHTAGMRYAIDVAFLNAGGIVVHSLSHLAPWRVGIGGPDAVHVLELPAGRLEETGTITGMRLSWS